MYERELERLRVHVFLWAWLCSYERLGTRAFLRLNQPWKFAEKSSCQNDDEVKKL